MEQSNPFMEQIMEQSKPPLEARQSPGKNNPKDSFQKTLKIEVAKELGLWEKIEKQGWAELTAQESGRIGGMMTRRMKQQQKGKTAE